MSIIRNLSASPVELKDLGGITVPANGDFDLREESQNDISNSLELQASITDGSIVFLDAAGNALTQQDSLSVQDSVSATQPAFAFTSDGNGVAGNPFSEINFKDNTTVVNATNGVDVDFMSNVGINTRDIDGQDFIIFADVNRSNKILTVEKTTYMFQQNTVSAGTYLKVTKEVTNTKNGYNMPMKATIVGLASHIRNPNGRTGSYALYVNTTNVSGTLLSYSGNNEQKTVINNLNYDVVVGDVIKFRCTNISGGGMSKNQYDISVIIYVRWRG